MEHSLKKNIYLIGLMGAGKTVIGQVLAKRLSMAFVDVDRAIEERTGVSIPTIFDLEGEAGFRKREAQALAELSGLEETVISTGGGAVLRAENRAAIQSGGFVIYLNPPLAVLWERVCHDRNRPLLNGPDPLATLEALFAARDGLYREIADLVVDSGRMKIHALLSWVLDEMGDRWKP